METKRQVGKNVRRIRVAKGLSQLKLGVECNLEPALISKLEGGKQNITLDTLDTLARALGVLPVDLLAPIEQGVELGKLKRGRNPREH